MSRTRHDILIRATISLMTLVAVCLLAGPVAAGSCPSGCSTASKTCEISAKIYAQGCNFICRDTFDASDHLEAAKEAYALCKSTCKIDQFTDQDACRATISSCESQCGSASDPDCADECGTTYAACAQLVKNAMTSCRNGCAGDGVCVEACATQGTSDLAVCKTSPTNGFDHCLSLGSACAAASICGNGIIEPGEECDGTPTCSPTCIQLDHDGDGILDDGDASGVDGDLPCTGGATTGCDDNCPDDPNSDQADADGDLIGDVCDYDCTGGSGAQVDGGVYANSVAPVNALPGALVSACKTDDSCCSDTVADGNGLYQFLNLNPGTYRLTAYSPGPELPNAITLGVGAGPYAAQDIVVSGPVAPAANTTITGGVTGSGFPSINPSVDQTLTTQACPNGTGTYTITQLGVVVAGPLPLPEDPIGSGNYSVIIPANTFVHGAPNIVSIEIICPNPDPPYVEDFTVYIDPSGFTRFLNGSAAVGATVTLSRADTPAGPFTIVPDGSAIMSPQNRTNPDASDATGHFGWDVIAGFYKVHAQFAGCVADSAVLKIPPPVTDLDLVFQCPCIAGPMPGCRTAEKNTLVLKNNANDAGDSFVWKWTKGQSTTQGEFGLPITSTNYAVCVYPSSSTPLTALTVPAGAAHWSQSGTSKYKYSDSAALSTGVKTVIVSWSDEDKTKIIVKGKGGNLPDPTLGGLPAPMVVQLQQSDSSICFESTFNAGDVSTNTPAQYKAVAP
jgi:hypothetical protein